jgi:hypothetical protein
MWLPHGSAALVDPLRCWTRRDSIGLDGAVSGGDWVGLAVGDATVRDMVEVGKELEHGKDHLNSTEWTKLTTSLGPCPTWLSNGPVPYGASAGLNSIIIGIQALIQSPESQGTLFTWPECG